MKRLLPFILLVSRALGADAANDVVMQQRNGANTAFVQRNVTAGANYVFVFNGSLAPTSLPLAAFRTSLGSGVADATTFLRGDGSWAAPGTSGGVAWGAITGTIANQTDLAAALSGKVPTSRAVATTGPLAGGGALSGDLTLSLPKATGSVDGYLASTDWTIFNGKESVITFSGPLSRSVNTVSIPAATSLVNGYLTSSDWTTFNAKQAALSFGNLTEATSAVLTISGGTGAVIGSGTTVQVKQATTAQSGFLTSADWNTFNAKQPPGSYITALTSDATASGPGSAALTLATVNANVGTFGSATQAGTFTVNAKGLVTAAANVTITPAFASLTGKPTTLAGYGITDGVSTARTISTTTPLAGGGALSGDLTLTIANAAADGTTKGAATFAASDFDASSGLVSIDYTNGQKATASVPGFLSSGDWTTFNSKQSAGSYITALTGDVVASGPGSSAATLVNIPSGTTVAGSLLATAITAPSTPAAGKGSVYVDSTSKNLAVKDDAGVVKHGVQTVSSTANQWINSISDAGVGSKSQPAFTDISGSVAAGQMPAITGDVNSSAGTVATTIEHSVTFSVSGGGAALATGVQDVIASSKYGGTLTAWSATASPADTITFDILRSADGGAAPSASIVGGSGTKPNVASGVNNHSTSFTNWTSTTISAYDNFKCQITAVGGTATSATVTLFFR